MIHNTAIVAK